LEQSGVWTSDGRLFIFEAGARNQTRIWLRDEIDKPARVYQLTADARNWRDPAVVPGANTIVAIAGQAQGQLLTLSVLGESSGGKLVLPGVSAYELDYSRDGKWVTYTLFPEQTVWRSRLDGSDACQISPAGLEAHQPRWSPDGSRIAFMGKWIRKGARWRIYLVSGSEGEPVAPKPEGDDQGVPTWSADGRSLIFGDLNSMVGFDGAAIHQIDLQTGEFTNISAPMGMWSPRMSPNGRFLAAVGFQSRSLYIRDNHSKVWHRCVTMDSVAEPIWSADSSWIQFAGRKDEARGLFRISPRCGELKQVVDLTAVEFVVAAWFGITPDGSPTGLVHVPEEIYAIDWRLRRQIP
jgi:Tol biopolymer transport system component